MEELLPRLLPAIIALYRRNSEPYHVTVVSDLIGQPYHVTVVSDLIGQPYHVTVMSDLIGQPYHVTVVSDLIGQPYHVTVMSDLIGQIDRVTVMSDLIGQIDRVIVCFFQSLFMVLDAVIIESSTLVEPHFDNLLSVLLFQVSRHLVGYGGKWIGYAPFSDNPERLLETGLASCFVKLIYTTGLCHLLELVGYNFLYVELIILHLAIVQNLDLKL